MAVQSRPSRTHQELRRGRCHLPVLARHRDGKCLVLGGLLQKESRRGEAHSSRSLVRSKAGPNQPWSTRKARKPVESPCGFPRTPPSNIVPRLYPYLCHARLARSCSPALPLIRTLAELPSPATKSSSVRSTSVSSEGRRPTTRAISSGSGIGHHLRLACRRHHERLCAPQRLCWILQQSWSPKGWRNAITTG
ncbi:hypothetical protein BCR34DRAFT_219729 [Clohesyomyces aquaticus]|uniref:Uncharacterized protein n=1 Tax=Clohesyomyces aquaticus TaxID=1231657 RepID=A0A1Y1Y9L9_9PLEO|nr:hypothetical protein BCR34DRAFT_219729 [Clohesyomyces aquaticus]